MNRSIKIIPFPEIDNFYVVISACTYKDRDNRVMKNMSFVWADENGGAEWEPDYGPITKLIPCKETDEEAQPHWFYPFYRGQGHWSQFAVEENELPAAFQRGDYEYIASVLKEWSQP